MPEPVRDRVWWSVRESEVVSADPKRWMAVTAPPTLLAAADGAPREVEGRGILAVTFVNPVKSQ